MQQKSNFSGKNLFFHGKCLCWRYRRRGHVTANVDWTGGFLSINLDQMASRKLKWQQQRAARKDVFNKFICINLKFGGIFKNMSSIRYLTGVLYYIMFSSVGLSYVLFSRRKNSWGGKTFRICELLNNLFSRSTNCFSWKQIDDCFNIFTKKVSQISKNIPDNNLKSQKKQLVNRCI